MVPALPVRPAAKQALPDLLDFELPAAREATAPPEARGLARDEVRLLVSYLDSDRLLHTRFRDLPCLLSPGDLLVVNTSGTLNAALPAQGPDGANLRLHLSNRLAPGLWTVELRRPSAAGSEPLLDARPGTYLRLPAGAWAHLQRPHVAAGDRVRLWVARLSFPLPWHRYLARHGAPIRYGYVTESWPAEMYQTVYATEPGSAEMPSAGRAFTPEIVTRLVARGVMVAPLLLHTGVASLEADEPPYPEPYLVPPATARLVNLTRAHGGRVIAVGTTTVRALETVAKPAGQAAAGQGWTDLVITPERGLRLVDGMLTGLHEPRASHLAMLEALAPRAHLRQAYEEALREGYLWHEFGDLHLLLPA